MSTCITKVTLELASTIQLDCLHCVTLPRLTLRTHSIGTVFQLFYGSQDSIGMCLLCISHILCVALPFSIFSNCSKALSREIFNRM